jgi:hypothetical protein
MKYLSVLIFLASTLLFSSCAKNIITNYQDKTENTGDLMVIPNKPVFNASITLREMINKDVNKLIIQNKNIKTVEIRNIPEGLYEMEFIYNNNQYGPIKSNQFPIIIKKDKKTSKLIQIPPTSLGNYIMGTALIIMMIVLASQY